MQYGQLIWVNRGGHGGGRGWSAWKKGRYYNIIHGSCKSWRWVVMIKYFPILKPPDPFPHNVVQMYNIQEVVVEYELFVYEVIM